MTKERDQEIAVNTLEEICSASIGLKGSLLARQSENEESIRDLKHELIEINAFLTDSVFKFGSKQF